MSNNPANYERLIKQYLRSIPDISANTNFKTEMLYAITKENSQEYLQPKTGRNVKIFCLGRKKKILKKSAIKIFTYSTA